MAFYFFCSSELEQISHVRAEVSVTHGNPSCDLAAFPDCMLGLRPGSRVRYLPPGKRWRGSGDPQKSPQGKVWIIPATWLLQDGDGPLQAGPEPPLGQHTPVCVHGQWAFRVGGMNRTSEGPYHGDGMARKQERQTAFKS